MKRIIAFALACLIALSSSVVPLQAVAAEGEANPAVFDEHKGKGVGLIIGCIVFFPIGCFLGALAGWGYDEFVEPEIVGEGN